MSSDYQTLLQEKWQEWCINQGIYMEFESSIQQEEIQECSKFRQSLNKLCDKNLQLQSFEPDEILQTIEILLNSNKTNKKQILTLQNILFLLQLSICSKDKDNKQFQISQKINKNLKQSLQLLQNQINLKSLYRITLDQNIIKLVDKIKLQFKIQQRYFLNLDKKIYLRINNYQSLMFQSIVKCLFIIQDVIDNCPWQNQIVQKKITQCIIHFQNLIQQKQKIFSIDLNTLFSLNKDLNSINEKLGAKYITIQEMSISHDISFYLFIKMSGIGSFLNLQKMEKIQKIVINNPQSSNNYKSHFDNTKIRQFINQDQSLSEKYQNLIQKIEFYFRIQNQLIKQYVLPFLAQPNGEDMPCMSEQFFQKLKVNKEMS